MKINNHQVKFEDGHYNYFSCTCAKEDEVFWDNALGKVISDTTGEISSSLIYLLSHTFDAVVDGLWADMWMGFYVKTNNEKLYITTDQLHYGLFAAYLILGKLHPESLDESEIGLLNLVE